MVERVPRNNILTHVATLTLVLCLSGCVSAPVQEMSNARQAIAAAEESGAVPYLLNQARHLMDEAERRLKNKQFGDAKRAAIAAKHAAAEAMRGTNGR